MALPEQNRRKKMGRGKWLGCLVAGVLFLSVHAGAQVTNVASVMFNAYSNAFYRANGIGKDTYFQNTQTGGGYTTFGRRQRRSSA